MSNASLVNLRRYSKKAIVSLSIMDIGTSIVSKLMRLDTSTRKPCSFPLACSIAPAIWYTYSFIYPLMQIIAVCRRKSKNKPKFVPVVLVVPLYLLYLKKKKKKKKNIEKS